MDFPAGGIAGEVERMWDQLVDCRAAAEHHIIKVNIAYGWPFGKCGLADGSEQGKGTPQSLEDRRENEIRIANVGRIPDHLPSMAALPHCNELFLRFFDRWYAEDDRQRRAGKTMPRPDLLTCAEYVGSSPNITSPLTAEFQAEALRRIDVMTQAALSDWADTLDLKGEMDLAWVEAVDAHYDTDRIAKMISCSDPKDFSNEYVVTCCEFGALLGHVMINLRPRLFWSPDWPYWESSLIDPASGSVIPVFHWGIKKMSSYGWDDLFAEKVQACLEMLEKPGFPGSSY